MKKIALVVGHRASDKGAQNNKYDLTEWDLNKTLVAMVRAKLIKNGKVEPIYILRDDTKDGYSRLPAKINATNPDYIIEFHYNSAGNANSKGNEVLYWHTSSRGKDMAEKFNTAIFDVLKVNNRGLKAIDNKDDVTGEAIKERGWVVLKQTKAPAVILEPAFFSNESDTINLLNKFGELADSIVRVIETL